MRLFQLDSILWGLNPEAVARAVIEIFVLSCLIYWVITLIQGTRGENIAKGIFLFALLVAGLSWITRTLELFTLNFLLGQAASIGVMALVISLVVAFQPELRKALERAGKSRFWPLEFSNIERDEKFFILKDLSKAAFLLARDRIGAIIVCERTMSVKEFVEGGVDVGAKVSWELLLTIFTPPGPLHDGAAIIRGSRLVYAKCFLPLTDNPEVSANLGSRHRAALGLTEQTDALVIVVSEESSAVTVALSGRLVPILDERHLLSEISALFPSSAAQASRSKQPA